MHYFIRCSWSVPASGIFKWFILLPQRAQRHCTEFTM